VFPGSWYHEVHNISEEAWGITNAVPWPKEPEEEEKKEPVRPQARPKPKPTQTMLGKRTIRGDVVDLLADVVLTKLTKEKRDKFLSDALDIPRGYVGSPNNQPQALLPVIPGSFDCNIF
jgi:hypothetical protein